MCVWGRYRKNVTIGLIWFGLVQVSQSREERRGEEEKNEQKKERKEKE